MMKLLTNQNYLLLVDEEAEIRVGDIAIHDFGMGYELEIPCDEDNLRSNTRHKVMAYYPLNSEAKELDLPLLPSFEVDNYSLAKKLNEIYDILKNQGIFTFAREEILKAENLLIQAKIQTNEQAAQSKQFTLEDIKKAIEMAREYEFIMFGNGETEHMYSENEIIQSLSTQQLPKEFIPEYEYLMCSECEGFGWMLECKKCKGEGAKKLSELKTITNSMSKEELIGTYK